ncbi:hypothetical protein [Falsirhodobacter sp. 20TX0035]|uniref:hypothetical protein n=1 Tax=Falsirhodobacter sp. 20TX0035 TaxID=3022019 RepID=UPI0023310859|nr:hypothetical protein [Falsirhodobacter sp. 20TX0035]MDB6453665.1 hypothetical protein [Falsirhodobacter sp. 20TX0035]
MKELPGLYFRIRDNGAFVFRLDTENRQRRLDLEHIATVNIGKGEYKTQGDRTLSPAEVEEIRAWIVARREVLAQRDFDAAWGMIEQMNLTTQWLQNRAGDDQAEALTEGLLMAMHDLRSVLVRRRADRFTKDAAD